MQNVPHTIFLPQLINSIVSIVESTVGVINKWQYIKARPHTAIAIAKAISLKWVAVHIATSQVITFAFAKMAL